MQILGCRWFNDVGIVRVETEHDGIRYYIKAIVNATTEANDARMIAEWGARFPDEVGDVLFGVHRSAKDAWEHYDEFN